MAIRVDINGDLIWDEELDDGGVTLPTIDDFTGDDKPDVDLRILGSSAIINGATFGFGVINSGTGNFNDFLGIQNTGTEAGFNSNIYNDPSNDQIKTSTNFTHAIKLSEIAITTINGKQYYDFRLDANENNSTPEEAQISLDIFQIRLSTNGNIGALSDLLAIDPSYDMDANNDVSVIFSDAYSSGSGRSDLAVLIPVESIVVPAGQTPADVYLYLYSAFGFADPVPDANGKNGYENDYDTDATFEEWRTQKAVILRGEKFKDDSNLGVKDPGEGPVGGVTINLYEDTNNNGVLDAGDQLLQTTTTNSNGQYAFYGVKVGETYFIDEVLPEGATQTTGNYETVTVADNAAIGSTINVDPIGNKYPDPSVAITKDAAVAGDCADVVGETILYTITVDNDGELSLTNVVLTDNFEGEGNVTLTPIDDGDGILEVDEVIRTGDDGDGILETNETWTYQYLRSVTQAMIDSNGGGNGLLSNTATVNANSTNGSVSDTDDASVAVCQEPEVRIEKTASVPGDCADVVGETITYTYNVHNDGNVALKDVVVSDDLPGLSAIAFVGGDTNNDGELDVDEVWEYSATRAVTQNDIDSNGVDADGNPDNDGDIDNIGEVNAKAVATDEAVSDTDDASVAVCQEPSIDVEKSVKTDLSGYLAEDGDDDPDGLQASTSSQVEFKVVVRNTGNVSLTGITLTDSVKHTVNGNVTSQTIVYSPDGDAATLDASNVYVDLNGDGVSDGAWSTFDTDGDGTIDSGSIAELAPNESFTLYYSLTSQVGQHENTAIVVGEATSTGNEATDSDDANYFVLASEGPGVRTPGFWQNMNNGGQFWDGVTGNENNAGQTGFADGELLYAVDSDGDSDGNTDVDALNIVNGKLVNVKTAGLLVGDYNQNGVTDAGEDTLFISYEDARTLINAKNNQMSNGTIKMGRDLVATWLNYLAGNSIGDGGENTAKHYIDDAIDWFQKYAGKDADKSAADSFDQLDIGAKNNMTSAGWLFKIDGEHDGADIHNALDEYNNFGTVNGVVNAHDTDDAAFMTALSMAKSVEFSSSASYIEPSHDSMLASQSLLIA